MAYDTAIKKLFNNINKTSEFEIIYSNNKNSTITYKNFIDVLKYIKYRSENNKSYLLTTDTSFDIKYNYSMNNEYRITIKNLDNINNFFSKYYQLTNINIFYTLLNDNYNNDNYIFIDKIKSKENVIDMLEYNIRIRLNEEKNIDNSLINKLNKTHLIDNKNINFRYKQRISLIIFDNKDGKLSIDLTIVKTTTNPNTLNDSIKIFEIEIEYTKGEFKLSNNILTSILNEIENIKRVLDNTNIILPNNIKSNIINEYIKILYNRDTIHVNNLYSMQPISTNIDILLNNIPNNYSVTEKSDGEKYQLLIITNKIYLLSNNLNVIETEYYIENMNNTIFEGELILVKNKRILLIYDCIYYNNKNIKNELMFRNRIEYIKKFLNILNINFYEIKYPDIKPIEIFHDKTIKYYNDEIKKFYSELNKEIITNKNDYIFYSKIIFIPNGINNSEIFLYSYILWNSCVINKNIINCPYVVDGLIYTGIKQKYTQIAKEQTYPIYKYKPSNYNSIDVYITFKKDEKTEKYYDIYDNTLDITNEFDTNTYFRVVNLFVGDNIGNKEIPIPFLESENNHEAFFPIQNNEIRDQEGNMVNDNTVVEIIYYNSNNIPHQYRWRILRTRWDKTETVNKHKKKYGNYKTIAEDVWKSILQSINIDTIKDLAYPNTYEQQKNILLKRINNNNVDKHIETKYYQKNSNFRNLFRKFNNWIKSNVIYNYCNTINKKKTVLDIGCGRGGDIMKWNDANIKLYIGLDPDYDGLYDSIDSAIVRYSNLKKKYNNFTNMIFINADARYDLISEIQKKYINTFNENVKNIDNYLKNKKYDIISYQFSIHYLFENDNTINNIINIHNNLLKINGYILCCLIEPTRLMTLLNKSNKYTSWYTDENGLKKKLFEIIKKFDGDISDKPGQVIDIYMSWISDENIYLQEYIVTPKLLIDTMNKSKCKLIDYEYFNNIYNDTKDWFSIVSKNEIDYKNKKYFESIYEFFEDKSTENKESKIWNNLFCYYIFKKNKE